MQRLTTARKLHLHRINKGACYMLSVFEPACLLSCIIGCSNFSLSTFIVTSAFLVGFTVFIQRTPFTAVQTNRFGCNLIEELATGEIHIEY